jgi:hypothetical protein
LRFAASDAQEVIDFRHRRPPRSGWGDYNTL